MSIPKTEHIIIKPRTESERVAITLEYLASFLIWTERLSQDELLMLKTKIEKLIAPTNNLNLNQILKDCISYLFIESKE
jgi:hypothetical protein